MKRTQYDHRDYGVDVSDECTSTDLKNRIAKMGQKPIRSMANTRAYSANYERAFGRVEPAPEPSLDDQLEALNRKIFHYQGCDEGNLSLADRRVLARLKDERDDLLAEMDRSNGAV